MIKKTFWIIPILMILLCANLALASPTIDSLSTFKQVYGDRTFVRGNCIATESSSATINYTIEFIDPSNTVVATKLTSFFEFEPEYSTFIGINTIRCSATNASADGSTRSNMTFLIKNSETAIKAIQVQDVEPRTNNALMFSIFLLLVGGALFLLWYMRKRR